MVCFICKLCTEYIFLIMMEQEKGNSHHFQTMLLPSPAGDDISSLHRMHKTSLDFLSCWHTGWRNREHCSQIQHYQLLYCQQNTSAKTSFLRKVLTIFWKQNQEKYQEGCGLRRALPNYQMSITRNNLRFGHSTFIWFTKASLRS